MADQWWRDAVIYQIYPKSFADSDGDGIGDIAGIRSRLHYLAELGVDAIWLSPFYLSPQVDGGYDVTDHRVVDPPFGDLTAAERLIAAAHDLGIKVIVDVVPNHTSADHRFFQGAMETSPGSAQWQRYHCVRGREGGAPPSNWPSVFGGSAWEPVRDAAGGPTGWWYLHLFDVRQPDLNWEHPDVLDEFDDVLRFWLDRGVDGFRIDVAHGLVKAAGYPDDPRAEQQALAEEPADAHPRRTPTRVPLQGPSIQEPSLQQPIPPETSPVRPSHALTADEAYASRFSSPAGPEVSPEQPQWDQPGVHEVWRRWRRIVDDYIPPRAFVGEVWVEGAQRLARYLRPDELHTAFNFDFLRCPWDGPTMREVIDRSLHACNLVGAPTTWVLENHDVPRARTRFGIEAAGGTIPEDNIAALPGVRADDATGRDRARAALVFMLGLPGSAYIYQGQELGLTEVLDLPPELRMDPAFRRTSGTRGYRDGCRVPIPWSPTGPSLGFSTGAPWLPQPPQWAAASVANQSPDPDSMLNLTRSAIRLRRELSALGDGTLEWLSAREDTCLVARRPGSDGVPAVFIAMNLGSGEAAVPRPGILLRSDPRVRQEAGVAWLPPNTAAWLR